MSLIIKGLIFSCIFLLITHSVSADAIIGWKGEDLDNGMRLALPTDWYIIQSNSNPQFVKVGVVDDDRVVLKMTNLQNSKNRPYTSEELYDYTNVFSDTSGIDIKDYSPTYVLTPKQADCQRDNKGSYQNRK